ncbi:Vta1 like-domain-containing protein, partial [Umbelopsis sp. PMI_123]
MSPSPSQAFTSIPLLVMESVPDDLKYLQPYLQRSQELQSREPVVSYYAKYYAAKLALSKGPKNKNTEKFVISLLDELETAKVQIGPNEAITDDLVGYAHIENFGLKVFENADNEDRAGRASKKTAKTFLAASVFLEILKTFGDIDPDVAGKIKYAKWKAADIMKAIKEGRASVPGPPGGDDSQVEATDVPSGDTDLASGPNFPPPPSTGASDPSQPFITQFPSPPSNFTTAIPPTSPQQDNLPSTTGFSVAANMPPSGTPTFPQGGQSFSPPAHANNTADVSVPTFHISMPAPTPQQPVVSPPTVMLPTPNRTEISQAAVPQQHIGPSEIAQAQKLAKFAISALTYDDIKTARENLLKALDTIGYNQSNNFGF